MYILQSKTNVCSIVVHFMARVSFFYPKFFEIIHAAFFDRKSFSVQMTSFRYALFLDKFFELYYYIMLCCLFDTYSIRLNTADCRQVMLTYPTTVSQLHPKVQVLCRPADTSLRARIVRMLRRNTVQAHNY